jgi:hypothetical protein
MQILGSLWRDRDSQSSTWLFHGFKLGSPVRDRDLDSLHWCLQIPPIPFPRMEKLSTASASVIQPYFRQTQCPPLLHASTGRRIRLLMSHS